MSTVKKANKASAIYYGLRVAQRVALLWQMLLAIIYWLLLINIVVANTFAQETVNHRWQNPDALNHTIEVAQNAIAHNMLTATAFALSFTIILCFIPRVRKFEKRMIVDSLVLIVFLSITALAARSMVSSFIGNHLN